MKLKYKLVKIKNPNKADAVAKYYAMPAGNTQIGKREISELISQRCSLTVPDIYGAIEALLEIITEQMANGSTVNLDEFGNFRLFLNSVGADSPEEFSNRNIKQAKVVFRPGNEFKRRIFHVKYLKVK